MTCLVPSPTYRNGQDGITFQGKHIDLYMPNTGEAHECFKDIQTSLTDSPTLLVNTRIYQLQKSNFRKQVRFPR